MIKILFLLGLVSCATPEPKIKYLKPVTTEAQQAQRDKFVGLWLGEAATDDGKYLRWLMERRPDGGFTVIHALKNNLAEQVKIDLKKTYAEMGIWGVSGNIYFTATRQYYDKEKMQDFDVTSAGLYDAYEIIEFDGELFTYQSLDTGNVYTVKRVPPGTPIGF